MKKHVMVEDNFMRTDPRLGKIVQTVFPTFDVPRRLKREAKRRGITVAALTRQVLKRFLKGCSS